MSTFAESVIHLACSSFTHTWYRRESPMFIPLIVSRGSKAEAYCQENELEYSYIDEIVAN